MALDLFHLLSFRDSKPDDDLQNVLAGHFDAGRDVNGSLPALPYAGMKMTHVLPVVETLKQQKQAAKTRLLEEQGTLGRAEGPKLLEEDEAEEGSAEASDSDYDFLKNQFDTIKKITDHEDIAALISNIKTAKRALNPAETNFPEVDLLLEYLIYDTKIAFEQNPEPRIPLSPNDTHQLKQQKTEINNATFRAMMYGPTSDLSQIQEKIEQPDHQLSPNEKNRFKNYVNSPTATAPSATGRYLEQSLVQTTIKLTHSFQRLENAYNANSAESLTAGDLTRTAMALSIEDHDHIANHIADIKNKKNRANQTVGLNPQSTEADLLLQRLIIKRKQTFDLTHRINKDDSPKIKQQKIATFNRLFKQDMDDHLKAIQRELAGKPGGLRIKRPEVFKACVNYLIEIDKTAAKMSATFDSAKTEMLAQIDGSLHALKSANNPEKYEGQFERLKIQLKGKITAYKDEKKNTPEQGAAFEWATEYALRQKVRTLNPTPENETRLHDVLTRRPTDYDVKPIAPKLSDAESLIDKMAAAKVKQQKVEETVEAAKDPTSFAGQLKTHCKDQKNFLSDIHNRLEDTENPHPELLKTFKAELNQVNSDHRDSVGAVHKEAGTHTLLNYTSAPLNTLRNNPSAGTQLSDMLPNAPQFIRKLTGPLPRNDNATRSARLPQLEVDTDDKENSGFIALHNQVNVINTLLEQREELEATLISNPNLATTSMRQEISDNTQALSQKMETLAQTAESLHNNNTKGVLPSLLASAPNIEEFSNKAADLHDSLHRKNFFNRRKVPTLLRFHPVLNWLAKKHTPGLPRVKYDPSAEAKGKSNHNTTYFEQRDDGKWYPATLRIGEFLMGEDGKPMTDTNNQKIRVDKKDGEVKFTGKELANLYAEFCRAHDLNAANGNAPKMKQLSSDTFRIQWAGKNDKENWLKFLRSRYQLKLKDKHNKAIANPTPAHEAGLAIKDLVNEKNTIGAAPGDGSNSEKKKPKEEEEEEEGEGEGLSSTPPTKQAEEKEGKVPDNDSKPNKGKEKEEEEAEVTTAPTLT